MQNSNRFLSLRLGCAGLLAIGSLIHSGVAAAGPPAAVPPEDSPPVDVDVRADFSPSAASPALPWPAALRVPVPVFAGVTLTVGPSRAELAARDTARRACLGTGIASLGGSLISGAVGLARQGRVRRDLSAGTLEPAHAQPYRRRVNDAYAGGYVLSVTGLALTVACLRKW